MKTNLNNNPCLLKTFLNPKSIFTLHYKLLLKPDYDLWLTNVESCKNFNLNKIQNQNFCLIYGTHLLHI